MKNDIQLNQKQELKLNPEILQSIRILQMNSAELCEYMDQEIMQNPVLEVVGREGESISSEELADCADARDGDWQDAYDRFEYSGNSRGVLDYEKYVRHEESLQEHLMEQLRGCSLRAELFSVCEYLIGSLDRNGYLFLPKEEFVVDTGWTTSILEEALTVIQEMDPVGVGARSLQECLRLQLESLHRWTAPMQKLVEEMLDDIAANRIQRIATSLGVKRKEAQEMVALVRRLEPKPGCLYADEDPTPYVVPDVVVERIGDNLQVRLYRDEAASLHYSQYYRELYEMEGEPLEVRKYLSDHFAAANGLMRSIQQRNETILKVSQAIVNHQEQFFEPKVRMLRPLTMQELAEELHVHISTVSRAVSGKYMECEGHLFPLKHFFGTGVSMQKDLASDASGISGASIRKMIRSAITEEDPAHPISDQKIADALHARGIQISRRTVTKYREMEGIEAASRRRKE